MVAMLLEGIHFIASVEALSLGAKAGIHPWIIYDIISNAAGNSWCVFSQYEIVNFKVNKFLYRPVPLFMPKLITKICCIQFCLNTVLIDPPP